MAGCPFLGWSVFRDGSIFWAWMRALERSLTVQTKR
jgi:hypothetical protein